MAKRGNYETPLGKRGRPRGGGVLPRKLRCKTETLGDVRTPQEDSVRGCGPKRRGRPLNGKKKLYDVFPTYLIT